MDRFRPAAAQVGLPDHLLHAQRRCATRRRITRCWIIGHICMHPAGRQTLAGRTFVVSHTETALRQRAQRPDIPHDSLPMLCRIGVRDKRHLTAIPRDRPRSAVTIRQARRHIGLRLLGAVKSTPGGFRHGPHRIAGILAHAGADHEMDRPEPPRVVRFGTALRGVAVGHQGVIVPGAVRTDTDRADLRRQPLQSVDQHPQIVLARRHVAIAHLAAQHQAELRAIHVQRLAAVLAPSLPVRAAMRRLRLALVGRDDGRVDVERQGDQSLVADHAVHQGPGDPVQLQKLWRRLGDDRLALDPLPTRLGVVEPVKPVTYRTR